MGSRNGLQIDAEFVVLTFGGLVPSLPPTSLRMYFQILFCNEMILFHCAAPENLKIEMINFSD